MRRIDFSRLAVVIAICAAGVVFWASVTVAAVEFFRRVLR